MPTPYPNPFRNPTASAVDTGPYGVMPPGANVPQAPRAQVYTPPATGFSGSYTPGSNPAYDALLATQQAQQRAIGARRAVVGATGPVLDAQGNYINAQEGVFPFQQQQINANRNVYNTRGSVLFPAQFAQIQASRNVNRASMASTDASRGVIGQQQADVAARQQEMEREIGAANNTADQAAVALYRRYTASRDAHLARQGVTAPAEVYNPTGAPLPVGLRSAPQTQLEVFQREDQQNQQRRTLQLDAARLVVSLLDNDRQRAAEVAQEAGLTVQEAQLMVSQAENQASLAGVDVNQAELGSRRAQLQVSRAENQRARLQSESDLAGLDVNEAELNQRVTDTPPAPGYVHPVDPQTGIELPSWVTPAEADQAKTQYEQNLKAPRAQVTTGGSSFAGISIPDLLNQYGVALYRQGDPNYISPTQIETEIVRRLMRTEGMDQEQAEKAMRALVTAELEKRRQAEERAAAGRPPPPR